MPLELIWASTYAIRVYSVGAGPSYLFFNVKKKETKVRDKTHFFHFTTHLTPISRLFQYANSLFELSKATQKKKSTKKADCWCFFFVFPSFFWIHSIYGIKNPGPWKMNFLGYRDSEKRPFYPHRPFYYLLSLDSIFKIEYQLAILWYFKYVTRGYY